MRLNAYDTFEDEVAMLNLAKKLQSEGMESMKQPHLWVSEPIRAIEAAASIPKQVLQTS